MSFQQIVLEQLDIHMQKNESRHRPDTLHKNCLKLDQRLKIKCKTIKLLEDKIGENLDDFGYGDDFLDTTPKSGSMKEIIDKLGFIKIINFCSGKDIVKTMRRQATN